MTDKEQIELQEKIKSVIEPKLKEQFITEMKTGDEAAM